MLIVWAKVDRLLTEVCCHPRSYCLEELDP
jgi:hypothetical protein